MRLIDADALIPLIQEDKIEGETLEIIKTLGEGLQAETLNQACDRHIKTINSMPTIEPKHGRWIKHNRYVECLLCHRTWNSDYNDTYAFNYCPNCGARMDEVEE